MGKWKYNNEFREGKCRYGIRVLGFGDFE